MALMTVSSRNHVSHTHTHTHTHTHIHTHAHAHAHTHTVIPSFLTEAINDCQPLISSTILTKTKT